MIDPVTMLQDGGFFMYPIAFCGVLAVAIALERAFYLVFRANINAVAFMAQVQKLVLSNNIDRAIKLCNAEPHAVLPRVVKAGLARANRSEKEIEDAIGEATLEVGPLLNRRTPFLALLANVATLTGLLGTIAGLVEAFGAVAHAIPEARHHVLAQGMAIALYTTAGGLYVAIPTLVAYSLVVARTNRILDDVERFAAKTVNLLGARRRGILEEEPLVEEPAAAEV